MCIHATLSIHNTLARALTLFTCNEFQDINKSHKLNANANERELMALKEKVSVLTGEKQELPQANDELMTLKDNFSVIMETEQELTPLRQAKRSLKSKQQETQNQVH